VNADPPECPVLGDERTRSDARLLRGLS
jgi:hypothetical protein